MFIVHFFLDKIFIYQFVIIKLFYQTWHFFFLKKLKIIGVNPSICVDDTCLHVKFWHLSRYFSTKMRAVLESEQFSTFTLHFHSRFGMKFFLVGFTHFFTPIFYPFYFHLKSQTSKNSFHSQFSLENFLSSYFSLTSNEALEWKFWCGTHIFSAYFSFQLSFHLDF